MSKHLVRQGLRILTSVFLITAIMVAGSALAYEVEPLEATRLIAACDAFANSSPDQSDLNSEALMCRSYLQGFFAATDEVVTTERIPSALTIRVLRTRGARVPEDQKKTFNASYCISETEILRDIARKISMVDKVSASNKTAQNLLRESLAEHYDCAKLKQSPDQG